jgi:hypothetical protein
MGGINRSLAFQEAVTENYYVYDIKAPQSSKEEIIQSISKGARRNAPGVALSKPVVLGDLPMEPAGFELTDPLSGSSFQSLAALSGTAMSFRVPKCDGVVLVGNAQKKSGPHDLRMHMCLFPY